jgi:hypothetical protein
VEYQYLYEDGKWNAYKVPSDEGKSVLMGDLKRVVRKGWYDEMNKA